LLNIPKDFGELFINISHLWRVQLDARLRKDERLRPYNLTLAKWRVLLRLSRNPEGLSQRQLADQVGVEGATMVGLVDRMTIDGLIERHPSPSDRRLNIIRLLPVGQQLAPIIEEHAQSVRDSGLQNIPREDLMQCYATLVCIRETLLTVEQ
jgi:MarR family transcriptional regulator, transcriptional regulator for hemolysin